LARIFFQYAEAEGLRILAFPCNQFGGQEPGTDEEIKAFAAAKGATFDMVIRLRVSDRGGFDVIITIFGGKKFAFF
jgi:glutathione peroxidase-family protein